MAHFGSRGYRSGQSQRIALANAAFDAVMKIGWPEGRIPLAEATVYLATSPKSNSAYEGINSALELVRQTGNLPVPLHLRNAPTKLMGSRQGGQGRQLCVGSGTGGAVQVRMRLDALRRFARALEKRAGCSDSRSKNSRILC